MPDDTVIISNLPSHSPSGSDYLAIENDSLTGKSTVNDVVGAATPVQTLNSQVSTLNSSSLLRKDTVADGTNIAGMTLQGVYALSGNNSYTGMPTGVGYGTLIIYRPFTSANSNFIVQEIVTTGAKTYRRIRTNDSWSAWKCLDDEVSTLNSKLTGFVGFKSGAINANTNAYITIPDISPLSCVVFMQRSGTSGAIYGVDMPNKVTPYVTATGFLVEAYSTTQLRLQNNNSITATYLILYSTN